jgi:hypothetical protein
MAKSVPGANVVTVDAKEEAAEQAKGLKIAKLSIEPVDNGYIFEEHFQPAEDGEGEGLISMSYTPPDRKVFTSVKDLAAYVSKELQAHATQEKS